MREAPYQQELISLIQKQFVIITIIFSTMIFNTLSNCKLDTTGEQKHSNINQGTDDVSNSNRKNLDATNVPNVPTLSELMEKISQQ